MSIRLLQWVYSLKSNSSVRVGRLYTVQGYPVERWTGAEIQSMLFSRVIDRGGACIHLEKETSFFTFVQRHHTDQQEPSKSGLR